jgi:hypothetical protein
MARHTIGYKRGSVRGAPPQVYIPFGTFEQNEDDPEPWESVFDYVKGLLLAALGFVILGFLWVLYHAFFCKDVH